MGFCVEGGGGGEVGGDRSRSFLMGAQNSSDRPSAQALPFWLIVAVMAEGLSRAERQPVGAPWSCSKLRSVTLLRSGKEYLALLVRA